MKINFKVIGLFLAILVSNQITTLNSAWAVPPKIVSSINPIYQIVNFIQGNDQNNTLLINPKISEHDYTPRPSDAHAMNECDVIFYISDNLEYNLSKSFSNLTSQPKIVQLSQASGIKLLSFQARVGEENTDPHIWLNPNNAIAMANKIAKTLSDINPTDAATYQENLKQFIAGVINADIQNRSTLSVVPKKSFIPYHNGLAYFEDYYQIPSAGVMTYYHDQDLTPNDVVRINDLIKKDSVSCVLGSTQEYSGNALAKQIAISNHINFITIDTMNGNANYPENGYASLITNLANNLVGCTTTKKN